MITAAPNRDLSREYLFESFLPYPKSVFAARWLQGLLRVRLSLRSPNLTIPPLMMASMALNATWLTKDASRNKVCQLCLSGLSSPSLSFATSRLWSVSDLLEFYKFSVDFLSQKIAPACNEKASLIEAVLKHLSPALGGPNLSTKAIKANLAFLVIWDAACVSHHQFHTPAKPDPSIDSPPAPLTPSRAHAQRLARTAWAHLCKAPPAATLPPSNISKKVIDEVWGCIALDLAHRNTSPEGRRRHQ